MKEFMDSLWSSIDWVGRISFLVLMIGSVIGFVSGVIPVIWRLGRGLGRRKIALFALADEQSSLTTLLRDSRVFRAKNIVPIATPNDIAKAAAATVFLVYWPDFKDHIDSVLDKTKDATAIVIYAPQAKGFLPPDAIQKLEKHRNVMISNFRGRLLNDLVVSMITTSYEEV